MAQILHMSGAGVFFHTLSTEVGENRIGAELTRIWAEMEDKIMIQALTTDLRETLG